MGKKSMGEQIRIEKMKEAVAQSMVEQLEDEFKKINDRMNWLKMHADEQDERFEGLCAHLEVEHDRITKQSGHNSRIMTMLSRLVQRKS